MGKIRQKLVELTADWRDTGLPPARELLNIGQALLAEKKKSRLVGLWSRPPSMVTATMDDGWGAGLESVRLYAEIAGVEVIHLGLLLEPEAILAGCLRRRPDLLGLTVLHFETEEILTCHIILISGCIISFVPRIPRISYAFIKQCLLRGFHIVAI